MVKGIKILRMLKNVHFNKKYNHLLKPYLLCSLEDKRVNLYPRPIDVGISCQVKNK